MNYRKIYESTPVEERDALAIERIMRAAEERDHMPALRRKAATMRATRYAKEYLIPALSKALKIEENEFEVEENEFEVKLHCVDNDVVRVDVERGYVMASAIAYIEKRADINNTYARFYPDNFVELIQEAWHLSVNEIYFDTKKDCIRVKYAGPREIAGPIYAEAKKLGLYCGYTRGADGLPTISRFEEPPTDIVTTVTINIPEETEAMIKFLNSSILEKMSDN